MKLDILVIAAHPDDAELGCSGTIAAHIAKGYKVGIVDLTAGEMGTRGTPELRIEEANKAAEILGLSARENMGFKDIFFQDNQEHQLELIKIIRKYQPDIVLANAVTDRHPDHGKGSDLATNSCFMSGLRRIETELDGKAQQAWRPKFVYHYIQNNYIEPDFVVDITDYWDTKVESILAFQSQFHDPNSEEPESFISNPDFLPFIEARAREMGHRIMTTYGEGFTVERMIGATDLFDLK
ncbi:MAG TPA: bacillithiol biosynthesis deacetylase BshB1 [Algoriphagus sp.]|jgi:bacillithiol biosynthesis deacetylase BshB1|uniref:bacillithiol biosynthesis deacetylase BshB1 n=2 Tax=Algoriphagus TaxID=246875 RepID=UPI000C503B56|nr:MULTISPECIES: bacillithiol biosynthesis deacetylase BshB1 [unclassified Algoriphagus]MAL11993.1 bacillithiol biosynthesis deacetylase BshB1 [Algoriphagus sp.]MAN87382.1 bacillithiol biosynthesis deacetylase BshB1 [Algoriphagus sp.]QYH38590.1 bacillithiol biosynthesis deacetylase BshB1 [Algoriphagus sp. NBT04N3]HAH38565.1 bacillithiol biosynthesis deacetylase BshB1 [Algoriphagus sp.]HAZ23458.1 bacillithiol biosynthesis deacetylase BshB1 [Algoriphagus sp.]|tara:strand:+ start:293 stop:1009 length:717 start_codon:yes stop_codon:yes gene_type:complete